MEECCWVKTKRLFLVLLREGRASKRKGLKRNQAIKKVSLKHEDFFFHTQIFSSKQRLTIFLRSAHRASSHHCCSDLLNIVFLLKQFFSWWLWLTIFYLIIMQNNLFNLFCFITLNLNIFSQTKVKWKDLCQNLVCNKKNRTDHYCGKDICLFDSIILLYHKKCIHKRWFASYLGKNWVKKK